MVAWSYRNETGVRVCLTCGKRPRNAPGDCTELKHHEAHARRRFVENRKDRERYKLRLQRKVHRWQLIDAAPKDGSTVLVWDGDVVGYPLAARWWWDEIREPTYKRQCKRNWPVVACKNGRWQPVEQEMIEIADYLGGLRPTHWLSWEPAPTPATMAAWDEWAKKATV